MHASKAEAICRTPSVPICAEFLGECDMCCQSLEAGDGELWLAFCWEKLKRRQQSGVICKVSEKIEDSPWIYLLVLPLTGRTVMPEIFQDPMDNKESGR